MLGGAGAGRVASGLLDADNPPGSRTTKVNLASDIATAKSLILVFPNRNGSMVHRRKRRKQRTRRIKLVIHPVRDWSLISDCRGQSKTPTLPRILAFVLFVAFCVIGVFPLT